MTACTILLNQRLAVSYSIAGGCERTTRFSITAIKNNAPGNKENEEQ
jgi:hypothetical protein